MKTIITPIDVYNIAFSVEESHTPSAVKEADIAMVESRYLIPVVGESLYSAILLGRYSELRSEYVVPMLCAWVRYVVEPLLAERCNYGRGTAVDVELMARLKLMAMSHTRRLSDYLNAHTEEFAEYNPIDNSLNHCSIDGNIVQVY
jgi:hypothetical protein